MENVNGQRPSEYFFEKVMNVHFEKDSYVFGTVKEKSKTLKHLSDLDLNNSIYREFNYKSYYHFFETIKYEHKNALIWLTEKEIYIIVRYCGKFSDFLSYTSTMFSMTYTERKNLNSCIIKYFSK